jgi:hypothetical protein
MFLKIDTYNNGSGYSGTVAMAMDWQAKTWSIDEDRTSIWQKISPFKNGTFEVKDWGVIWLWDQFSNIMIIWDAPRHAFDFKKLKAAGRIFAPRDTRFKDATFQWSIDLTKKATPSAPTAAAPLSPFRQHLLQRLNKLLPAPYLSENYKALGGMDKTKVEPGYTSCGTMPQFVTSEMGLFKGLKGKAHMDYMNKYSLSGTNVVRMKGVRYNCWRENDLKERPIPGDIYCLLNRGATDKKLSGISHVGVIQDATGEMWKTMDLGQGSGFDGKKDVQRPYKPVEGELFGETIQGGGYRVLAGWVNVDEYLKLG